MKFIQAIILIIVILVSVPVSGQIGFTKVYSNAQTALIIDSLENRITTANNYENANLIFSASPGSNTLSP